MMNIFELCSLKSLISIQAFLKKEHFSKVKMSKTNHSFE